MQKLADDFTAKTGIKVNMQLVPLNQFYDKLVTAVSGGQAPDAAEINTPWLGQLIDQKVIAPLNSYVDGWSGKKDIIPSLWSGMEDPTGKTIYAVPQKYLVYYLYYRKDLFQAAGLKPPTTHAQFMADAKALTDASSGQYGFDIRGGANGQDQWLAWLLSGGGKLLNSSGKVVLGSNTAAEEANQDYLTLLKYSPPGAIGDSIAQVEANFEAGHAAMIIHHIGSSKVLSAALGDKLGVVPIPQTDPKNPTYLSSQNMNAILAPSEHKAAAFAWISYLAEKKAQVAYTESVNGALPVDSKVADMAEFKNQFWNVSTESGKHSVSWPSLPGVTQVQTTVWQKQMQAAFLGQQSSRQALQTIGSALTDGN